MSSFVLDASAALAYLQGEAGHQAVAEILDDSAISVVNVAEVATKLADKGAYRFKDVIQGLRIEIIDFDEALAYRVAELRHATRQAGLSLGDRACLATAQHLGARAVTADRSWSRLKIGVEIRVIR